MTIQNQEVTLRKLVAEQGKIIVSKEQDGGRPITISHEIYLGDADSPENYEEIDESEAEKYFVIEEDIELV